MAATPAITATALAASPVWFGLALLLHGLAVAEAEEGARGIDRNEAERLAEVGVYERRVPGLRGRVGAEHRARTPAAVASLSTDHRMRDRVLREEHRGVAGQGRRVAGEVHVVRAVAGAGLARGGTPDALAARRAVDQDALQDVVDRVRDPWLDRLVTVRLWHRE